MNKLPGFLIFTLLCAMVMYFVASFIAGSFIIEDMGKELRQIIGVAYLFLLTGYGMYHYRIGPFEDLK